MAIDIISPPPRNAPRKPIQNAFFEDTGFTFWLPSLFGVGLRSGLFVFIYRQFFSGFPKELEEAAYIDGCGAMKTFLRILVPNAGPAFTTVFLFCIVFKVLAPLSGLFRDPLSRALDYINIFASVCQPLPQKDFSPFSTNFCP